MLIPIRIFIGIGFSYTAASNLIAFIFVIVFIGGLMILLTSVASVIYQEQIVGTRILLGASLGGLFLFIMKEGLLQEWADSQRVFFN